MSETPSELPPAEGRRAVDTPVPMSAALAREYARSTPRAQYRQARGRRKAIIFSTAAIGLAAAFILGALGVLGIYPGQIDGEFSKKIITADVGDTPCPTPGARPVDPEGIEITVLNTTSTPGLALEVGTFFADLGYTVLGTDNAPPYRGSVEIETGPAGVDAAYTVARYLGSNVRIRLNQTERASLTILLGPDFDGLPSAEDAQTITESTFALVPLAGCLPLPEEDQAQSGEEQSGQSGRPH